MRTRADANGHEYTQRRGYRDYGATIRRDDGAVEAWRYSKTDGCSFTGWVVRSTTDPHDRTDPLPNKPAAVAELLAWDHGQ